METTEPLLAVTLPDLARAYGFNIRTLRSLVRRGHIPLELAGKIANLRPREFVALRVVAALVEAGAMGREILAVWNTVKSVFEERDRSGGRIYYLLDPATKAARFVILDGGRPLAARPEGLKIFDVSRLEEEFRELISSGKVGFKVKFEPMESFQLN